MKLRIKDKWILCWIKTALYDCNDPTDVDLMTDQIYMSDMGYKTL